MNKIVYMKLLDKYGFGRDYISFSTSPECVECYVVIESDGWCLKYYERGELCEVGCYPTESQLIKVLDNRLREESSLLGCDEYKDVHEMQRSFDKNGQDKIVDMVLSKLLEESKKK